MDNELIKYRYPNRKHIKYNFNICNCVIEYIYTYDYKNDSMIWSPIKLISLDYTDQNKIDNMLLRDIIKVLDNDKNLNKLSTKAEHIFYDSCENEVYYSSERSIIKGFIITII